MKLRLLVMALALFSLLAPAAGAIYIPGQEIPNDGLFHIMSAGADASVSSSPVSPWGAIFQGMKVPSFSTGGGIAGSSGFSMAMMPTVTIGGDVISGSLIGQIPDPGPAPYWGGPAGMELAAGMPRFKFPALFG